MRSALFYLLPRGRRFLRYPDLFLSNFAIFRPPRRLISGRDGSREAMSEASGFLKERLNESFLGQPPHF